MALHLVENIILFKLAFELSKNYIRVHLFAFYTVKAK